MSDIKTRVEELRKRFEAQCQEDAQRRFPSLDPPTVRVDYGPKYARIVREHSASGFVDLQTGAIYYPKSYKGPTTKHIRGSVLAEDFGLSAFGTYAVKTLR